MATYEYRCPDGHVTELVMPMADDKPESVHCGHAEEGPVGNGSTEGGLRCLHGAARVWEPWAATHFHGTGGTYHEDVYRGKDSGKRYGWKRRPNAGDDLPVAGL